MGEPRIEADKGTGEEDDFAEEADDVGKQSQAVQPEDGRDTLLGLGQEEENDEQDDRRPELAAVVDADADAVLIPPVHFVHRHLERTAVDIVDGDILGERIEIRSHVGRRLES